MALMKKTEAESAIRSLCHDWVSQQTNAELVHPSFSNFATWLEANQYGHYLKFRSLAGPEYDAEMWFDAEIKAARFRATKIDLAEILEQLMATLSPTASGGDTSLDRITKRLSRHTVTNDELAAIKMLKEAGSGTDAALIKLVHAVFAKRSINI